MSVKLYLKLIIEERAVLTREQARELMQEVLSGAASEMELAALLGALAARGEHATELAGFVDAMRAAATPIPLEESERAELVDSCGTGADASNTFNISTAAALVAAAAAQEAGAQTMVAKHGNRAENSQCGSADVLEALGIPVTLAPDEAAEALRTHRFAFLHAPSLHPALKAVMPVRRALGVRTIFNVLGPMANPAGARAQVMGVYSAALLPVVAETMRLLGVRHALVVHGAGASAGADARGSGLDELSICGSTQIAEVRGDQVRCFTMRPEDVGLAAAGIETLRGRDAAANAAILRGIFFGERGPRRDVVLLNASAVLVTAGMVAAGEDMTAALRAGIELAARTIDSGSVTRLVERLGQRQL